ncbi:hypothetical protein HFO64_06625 [Rhizobium laguerreae]|nr:hypothetical protein [Rhizobium laguerreae]
MSSVVPWRQYQRDVADHFQRLGFSVVVEEKIDGARESHVVEDRAGMVEVDYQVLVETIHGNR